MAMVGMLSPVVLVVEIGDVIVLVVVKAYLLVVVPVTWEFFLVGLMITVLICILIFKPYL